MKKIPIITILLLVGISEVSAQADSISAIQKQYNYFRYLWEEYPPNTQLSFPFVLDDFDQPTLFKQYSRNSIAAYSTSKSLIPNMEIIEKSKERFDPESRFLYQPGDSIIRYRPQEVFCLHKLDEVTDSIGQFADNIKALVIMESFSGLAWNGGVARLRKVLEAFKNVKYLEIGDVNNGIGSEELLELILQIKSFDQVEYLYLNNITLEQTLQIHERYHKLKSLIIHQIDNPDEIPLPSPFLNCLDLSLLSMPLPATSATGNEFSHLRKLESLFLRGGECITFTNESLSTLNHLKQLCYTTSSDSILFSNKNIEMLYLNIVSSNLNPTYIQINAPSLRIVSVSRQGDLSVRINNAKKIETMNIDATDKINLRIESKMKSLSELSLYSNVLDFYSRYHLTKNLKLELNESIKINIQNSSKELPLKEPNNQLLQDHQ